MYSISSISDFIICCTIIFLLFFDVLNYQSFLKAHEKQISIHFSEFLFVVLV